MTKTRDLADLGGGFLSTGVDAKQRTVKSKLQDMISVLDFIPKSEHAAIKNDTSTYDAGADIQAAIDNIAASGGGTLFFPNGTYNTTSIIYPNQIVNLVGESAANTAIVSSAKNVFQITNGACPHIKLLKLNTTNTTSPEDERRALYVTSTGQIIRASLEDLQLRCNNGPGYGLYVEGLCIDVSFERCAFDKSIKIIPLSGAVFNNNRFSSCRFGITTPHSFNSQRICEVLAPASSQVITFLNCTFEYGNVLIQRTGPSGGLNQVGLYGCWMGDDLVGGQTLTLDTLGSLTIDGCYFYGVDIIVNDVIRGTYRNVQAKSCTWSGDCNNTYIENCSATGNFYNGLDSSAANYSNLGDGLVQIKTDSPEFNVTTGFGINTTTPGQLLHVQAKGNNAQAGFRLNPTNSVGGVSPYTEIVAISTGSSDSALAFRTKGSNVVNEVFRATADKRFGIGTINPSGLLHCYSGTAHNNVYINTAASAGYDANLYLNGGTSGSVSVINLGYDADPDYSKIARSGSGSLEFVNNGSVRTVIDSSGRFLIGATSNSGGALLQVNGDRIRIANAKTPASASDTGTAGEICWDSDYVYVCTATDTWKRAAIATW